MEPAATIIRVLGGVTEVARITGCHRNTVVRWKMPTNNGTCGRIPFKHVPTLLEAARNRGVSLSADDFLPARKDRAA